MIPRFTHGTQLSNKDMKAINSCLKIVFLCWSKVFLTGQSFLKETLLVSEAQLF